jgi:membrane protein YdbS with pleckstrin-like domain
MYQSRAQWSPIAGLFLLLICNFRVIKNGLIMAKKVIKKHTKQTKKASVSPFNIYWEKKNYYLLIAGFLIIITGFYFMSIGSWNSFPSLVISPILLIIGYVLVFPLSIFYRKKSSPKSETEEVKIDTGKS